MFNSSTTAQHGHGFWCVECEKVTITDSTFYNLTSLAGSAIYLQNLDNSDSRIEGNYFEANRAKLEGGAVVLANTKNLSIANNTFKRNYVAPIVPTKFELIEFLDDDDDVLQRRRLKRKLQAKSRSSATFKETVNQTFSDRFEYLEERLKLDVLLSEADLIKEEFEDIE